MNGGAVQALVWKRIDFRESSRLVTLFTRERGRVTALAKGAHRPTSALLGRVDFLNACEVTLRGAGLPTIGRLRLVHEPRGLRDATRYRAVSYLVELIDRATVDGRADPELFDLATGAITLCERVPPARLPHCLLGLELRLLRVLGQAPALGACSACGEATAVPYAGGPLPGLFDRRHAPAGARRVPDGVVALLAALDRTPGRGWPAMAPDPLTRNGLRLTGQWLSAALDHRARGREPALRALFDGRGAP